MNGSGQAGIENWPALFEPDGKGPWAVRYNWIRHEQNEEFLANYFAPGTSALKLNLRNLTKDIAHLWKPHNEMLARGEISGRMVFRIKALNETNRSIDHLEVWRSREDIESTFHDDENPTWPVATRQELGKVLAERGFILCPLERPYPLISKAQAVRLYSGFVKQLIQRDRVRIESRMNFAP